MSKLWKKIIIFLNSTRVQLVFYMVIVIVMVLTGGLFLIYRNAVTILKENNEKYLEQQLIQAEYNIQNVFNELDRLSKTIVLNEDVMWIMKNSQSADELEWIQRNKNVVDNLSNSINNSTLISSVYFYFEDGSGIGANEKYTTFLRGNGEDDKPFPTHLFNKSVEAYPKKVFSGNITEEYFTNIFSEENIISQSRYYKSTSNESLDSILVLSIKEEYISSIYSKAETLNEGESYILNAEGIIVSSNEKNRIGQSYKLFDFIDFSKEYGSFSTEKEKIPVQGFYYKLWDTDWYIVTEVNVEVYLADIISMQRILLIIFVLIILSIVFVSTVWVNKIYRPLNTLSEKINDLGMGQLGTTFDDIPPNEFGSVMRKFNEMSASINRLMVVNDKIHIEKRDLEIESLQSQINPHFLYNTLNMVKWMAAGIKAENIVNCIITLGNMLKPVFNNITTIWTIGEELTYVTNYLKIINWRYENNIFVSYDIGQEYYKYKIPRFIIQPIIENAITHGMISSQKKMEIKLSIKEIDPGFHITVTNTGENIDSDRLEKINMNMLHSINDSSMGGKESIGLSNVNRRIKLSLGEECLVKLENIPEYGVKTIIMIRKKL